LFPNPVDWLAEQPLDLYRDIRNPGARYSASDEVIADDYGNPRYSNRALEELLSYLLPGTIRSYNTD
jgi:hypothetical protein